jgi:hypothetical protein
LGGVAWGPWRTGPGMGWSHRRPASTAHPEGGGTTACWREKKWGTWGRKSCPKITANLGWNSRSGLKAGGGNWGSARRGSSRDGRQAEFAGCRRVRPLGRGLGSRLKSHSFGTDFLGSAYGRRDHSCQRLLPGHGARKPMTSAATRPMRAIHPPALTPSENRMRPMTITASAIAARSRSRNRARRRPAGPLRGLPAGRASGLAWSRKVVARRGREPRLLEREKIVLDLPKADRRLSAHPPSGGR